MFTGTHHHLPSIEAGRVDRRRADEARPSLPSVGDVGQVEQQAAGDQFFVLTAGVELRGIRRIATEDALHDGGAGGLAERDGGVDPLVAGRGVELMGEHRHGGLLRRPTSTSG